MNFGNPTPKLKFIKDPDMRHSGRQWATMSCVTTHTVWGQLTVVWYNRHEQYSNTPLARRRYYCYPKIPAPTPKLHLHPRLSLWQMKLLWVVLSYALSTIHLFMHNHTKVKPLCRWSWLFKKLSSSRLSMQTAYHHAHKSTREVVNWVGKKTNDRRTVNYTKWSKGHQV